MPVETKPGRGAPARAPILHPDLARALALLALAALTSSISQASMAPVYGAIPITVNHQAAMVASTMLGFLLRWAVKTTRPGRVVQYLAVWAVWMPVAESYAFGLSGALGPVRGPIATGLLGCHTIVIAAAYAAAEAVEPLLPIRFVHDRRVTFLVALLGTFHLIAFEHTFTTTLPALRLLLPGVLTPVKMRLLVAMTLAYLAPTSSMFLPLALPALVHAFLANAHFDSARTFGLLDAALRASGGDGGGWTVLDRRWSNTGYVAVLESLGQGYRVMRCDHSLLGGEWVLTDVRREAEGWRVEEPIYAVFAMLEAVRLVEREAAAAAVADADARALVVGLGVGTAPKALIAHGIDTTVVELDPIVHEYAMRYFGLPANHTAVLRDAVSWVGEEAAAVAAEGGRGRGYDYIIHDVFTGGAEPLGLFTEEFLRDLRSLLREDGLIALNYAGDITMPLTALALDTIDAVFDGGCKIFRDTPPSSPSSSSSSSPPDSSPPSADKAAVNGDFTNMVVFCRNGRGKGPITFRQPTEADFLGSRSRKHYLLPNPEFEIPFPGRGVQQDRSVLRRADVGKWSGQQVESAIKHWHIMRKVVPDAVWELW